MKKLHKLIVLSNTYQQSSESQAKAAEEDPADLEDGRREERPGPPRLHAHSKARRPLDQDARVIVLLMADDSHDFDFLAEQERLEQVLPLQ